MPKSKTSFALHFCIVYTGKSRSLPHHVHGIGLLDGLKGPSRVVQISMHCATTEAFNRLARH